LTNHEARTRWSFQKFISRRFLRNPSPDVFAFFQAKQTVAFFVSLEGVFRDFGNARVLSYGGQSQKV
jgi:hypothetical protein